MVCFGTDATGISGADKGTALWYSSRGYAQTSMWAHYGDLHKGAVLIFDRKALVAEAEDLFGSTNVTSGMVSYESGFATELAKMQMVSFDKIPDVNQVFESQVRPTLLTKSDHWQQEREFRIGVVGWEEAECALPIAQAIRGVVFGYEVEPFRFETGIAVAERCGGWANAAITSMNNLVLDTAPIVDHDGTPRWWTKEQRHRGEMFNWYRQAAEIADQND